jgi:hypothetical protein
LKLETSASVTPRTIPDAVRTVGAAVGTVSPTVFGVLGADSGVLFSCALAEVRSMAGISQSAMKDLRYFRCGVTLNSSVFI